METKREIRQKIRRKRREIPKELWLTNSEKITAAIISHPWFLEAADIYTYVAYNREARTQEVIDAAFQMGKNVWVPKVMGEIMEFFRIGSMEELEPGAYGIPEPAGNERADEGMDRGLRLMFMPGVAFDEACHRVGWGGGYYDRYLALHPKIRTIALAFEFQVFPEIPYEEHDICPDILITEERIIISGDIRARMQKP